LLQACWNQEIKDKLKGQHHCGVLKGHQVNRKKISVNGPTTLKY
jgi:hypothetical protein